MRGGWESEVCTAWFNGFGAPHSHPLKKVVVKKISLLMVVHFNRMRDNMHKLKPKRLKLDRISFLHKNS